MVVGACGGNCSNRLRVAQRRSDLAVARSLAKWNSLDLFPDLPLEGGGLYIYRQVSREFSAVKVLGELVRPLLHLIVIPV